MERRTVISINQTVSIADVIQDVQSPVVHATK